MHGSRSMAGSDSDGLAETLEDSLTGGWRRRVEGRETLAGGFLGALGLRRGRRTRRRAGRRLRPARYLARESRTAHVDEQNEESRGHGS